MNIAVVGSGIAGLTAAWLLGRRHEVTLFERQPRPGFTASSVAVPWRGQQWRVDVPLRVFYAGYYPTLVRLYRELGVATEPVSYATTFTGENGVPFFRYRNLRLGSRSWAYVLPQDVAGQRARRIVVGALRFHRQAPLALRRGELAGRSIGEYVAAAGYAPEFVDGLLLPAIATVCTCSYTFARGFPAEVIVDYLGRGLARESVRRATLGADDAAARLLAGIGRVHCDARIEAVLPTAQGVQLQLADGSRPLFDHVVLATQANQALKLLREATPAERAVLGGFAYRPIEVVMHSDTALMPAQRGHWSAVNAVVGPDHDQPESTIWVNAVQPGMRGAPPVFQTVHPLRTPRDELVIGRARFERPVVDAASQRALQGLLGLHAEPSRRTWLCGSYAQPGIPLLESAVASAYAVAAAIDGAVALNKA